MKRVKGSGGAGIIITISLLGHGLETGVILSLNFTSGDATDGIYTIQTVEDVNTFTVTATASQLTSGDVSFNVNSNLSNPTVYLFHAGNNMKDNQDIVWQSNTYTKMPCEAKGFKFKVRATWRSAERQQFYLSRGWSNTPTSQHMNFTNGERASYAIDLLPDIPNVYSGVKANCIERNRETGEFSVVRDARGKTVTGPAFSEEAAEEHPEAVCGPVLRLQPHQHDIGVAGDRIGRQTGEMPVVDLAAVETVVQAHFQRLGQGHQQIGFQHMPRVVNIGVG